MGRRARFRPPAIHGDGCKGRAEEQTELVRPLGCGIRLISKSSTALQFYMEMH